MSSFDGSPKESELEDEASAHASRLSQFATEERLKLERVGFGTAGTVALMRAAGPGHCAQSVILVEVCVEITQKKVRDVTAAASYTLGVISRLLELKSNAVDCRNSLFKFFPGLKETKEGKDLIHCKSNETMIKILKGAVTALELKGVKLPPDYRENNEPVGKGLLAEAFRNARIRK